MGGDEDDDTLNEQLLQSILASVNDFNIGDYLIDESFINNNNSNAFTSSTAQSLESPYSPSSLLTKNCFDALMDQSTLASAQFYKTNSSDALLVDEVLQELHYDDRRREIEDYLTKRKREEEEKRLRHEAEQVELENKRIQLKKEEREERERLEREEVQRKMRNNQDDYHYDIVQQLEEEEMEVDQQAIDDIDRLLRSAKRVASPTIHSPSSASSVPADLFSSQETRQYLERGASMTDLSHLSDQLNSEVSDMDEEEKRAKHIQSVRSHFVEQEVLKQLSDYLSAKTNRTEKGRARAFRICPAYYAIGTSHGIVLLFGRQDRKVSQLRLDESGKQYKDMNQCNSVTSLDITPSGDFILSGYERGQVVLWDTRTKSVLKRFTIAGLLSESSSKIKSLPSYSIDNVCFLHDKMQFVVSCHSVLFMVTVSKALFGYSSDVRLVLGPKAKFGPIRHVNVLGAGLAPHPTNVFMLIAVATDSQVLIVNLSSAPTFQILYRLTKPTEAGPTSVPYLAWRRVSLPLYVPQEDNEVMEVKGRNPHLAVGWGNIINLFQFYIYKERRTLEMDRVSYMHVTHDVIGLCWLEERVLAFVDSSFKMTVADPFVQQKVQSISVREIEMVHHSRFMDIEEKSESNNQATVSKVPIMSYHHSYEENAGMLFLLGSKQIVSVKVLSWKQRIDALLETGSWRDTLQLALDFYQGRELAVIGLPTDTFYQQLLVGQVISQILIEYLDAQLLSVSSSSFTDEANKEKFFEEVALYCIEIALEIQGEDLIFTGIFERFRECQQSRLFLRIVENLVVCGRLRKLPEDFTSELVAVCTQKKDFRRLEECLININVEPYRNINDLLVRCLRHKMYKAYVYIMNRAKKDYLSPLKILLRIVFKLKRREESGDETDEEKVLPQTEISTFDRMKNMLFEYLNKLFNGEEYPSGQIPHQVLSSLKINLLEFLFTDNSTAPDSPSSDDEILVLSSQRNLPYLIRFLALDVRHFLEIINMSLNDQTPTTPWNDFAPDDQITQRYILEVLVSVMIHRKIDAFSPWEINKSASDSLTAWLPNLDEVVSFLKLLLPFMSLGTLPVDAELVHRTFAVLGFKGVIIQEEEKDRIQQQLMNVVERIGDDTPLDVDKLLQVCEKAQFYKVSVHLQTKYENYERILDSYLKDQNLRPQIFQYIHSTLTKLKETMNQQSGNSKKAAESYNTLRTAITNNLSLLIDLNDDETSHLIIYHFTEEYEQIIGALSDFPKLQFKFLRNIIGIGGEQSAVSDSMSQLLSQRGIRVGDDLHQRFLALLCQHEPKNVLPYLRFHEGQYDLDYAVNSCQKYRIIDASAYLLERVGDVVGAVGLYLETLSDNIFALKKRLMQEAKILDPSNDRYLNLEAFQYINPTHNLSGNNNQPLIRTPQVPLLGGKNVLDSPESQRVSKNLMKAISVCDRNAVNETIEPERLKHIWYSLLDNFVQLQREQRTGYRGVSTPRNRHSTESPRTPTSPTSYNYDKPVISIKENILLDLDNDKSVEQNIREHEVMIQSSRDNIAALEKHIIKEFSQERLEQLQQKLSKLRSQLSQLQDGLLRLRSEQAQAMNNPLAAHNIPKLAGLWLQICFGSYIKIIYSSMITSSVFEWTEILEFTVERYGSDHFGHFKESLTELFTNCTFEGTTYQSMKHLMDKDLYWMFKTYSKLYNRGVKPLNHRCYVCEYRLSSFRYNVSDAEENEVKLFDCGHAFHNNCLKMINLSTCPICTKHKNQSGLMRTLSPTSGSPSVPQQASTTPPAQQMTRKQRLEYEEEISIVKRHRLRRVEVALGLNKPRLALWNNMASYDLESYQRNRKLETIQQQDHTRQQVQQLEAMNQPDDSQTEEDNDQQQQTTELEADSSHSLLSGGIKIVTSFLGSSTPQKKKRQSKKRENKQSNRKYVPSASIDLVSDFDQFFN